MRTALFLLFLAGTANAHWSDWDARRETDPYGRCYAVLRYDRPSGGHYNSIKGCLLGPFGASEAAPCQGVSLAGP